MDETSRDLNAPDTSRLPLPPQETALTCLGLERSEDYRPGQKMRLQDDLS
jgi:hypothetical protein